MTFAQDGSVYMNRVGIAGQMDAPVLRERDFRGCRPWQPKGFGGTEEAESGVVGRRRGLAADEE